MACNSVSVLPPITLEITAEDIYEVLVGACADGTLCLYALCVEPELTRWEHGPLPSSDVRAGTAGTSR